MNPDEFEYFFDLDELEPFAAIPLPQPLPDRDPGARRTPSDESVTEPPVVVPPKTVVPQSKAVLVRPDEGAQQKSRDCPVVVGTEVPQIDRPSMGPVHGDVTDPAGPAIPVLSASPGAVTPPGFPPEQTPPCALTPVVATTSPERGADREWREANRPWRRLLSVHALGQFAFCSRSGIYAAEHGDETDVDEPPLRLDYLPNFDLAQIEERLSQLLPYFWMAVLLALAAPVVMITGLVTRNRLLAWPALTITGLSWLWLLELVRMIVTLLRRRSAARRAALREPGPDISRIEDVNWWSMLRAGFTATRYQRPFRHPQLPLEGCPWHVLERASLRIPVIRSGADKLGDAKHAVYPKHEIRLAAYAVLLEATAHVDVPYGLIFPADSHLGLAVPITRALRNQVAEQLDRALGLLSRSQRGESEPRPPQDRKRCAACRLGQPVRITDREIARTRMAGTPLLILEQHASSQKFHCECGDRFGSAPPHRRILQLGLMSNVE